MGTVKIYIVSLSRKLFKENLKNPLTNYQKYVIIRYKKKKERKTKWQTRLLAERFSPLS